MKQETLKALYYIGYNCYRQGKLDDAESLFGLLTTLNRHDSKHWMGLAGVYQMQKRYRNAIDAYKAAYQLNENDPKASFHAAECYFALGEKNVGLDALKSAERAIHRQAIPDQNMLAHISLIKGAWTNKNSNR